MKSAIEQHNAKVNERKQVVNLVNLIENYGSEDKCHAYLEGLRWPEGVECPRCQSQAISRIQSMRQLSNGKWEPRRQYDCDSCRYQFSVRVGTIFHDSKLPLWKWFLATYMMVESKKGISANQLKRTLSVSYKTAWYLCHRIRASMKDDNPEILEGTIEVDETYIGGKQRNRARDKKQAAAERYDNKTMVMGAIERGGEVRFRVERDKKRGTSVLFHTFVNDHVALDAEAVYTDEHRSYRGIGKAKRRHETVEHRAEEWVRADVHTNTIEGVFSLFKRALVGSYHQLSAKHLDAYLDEFSYRFNNRDNPYLFRDTLLALVREDPMTYKELTAPL